MNVVYLKGRRPENEHFSRVFAEDERLFNDQNMEIASGPAWSMILIFVLVPLIVVMGLIVCVFAIISIASGMAPAELLQALGLIG